MLHVQALIFGGMQHSGLDRLLVLHALSIKASAVLQLLQRPDADPAQWPVRAAAPSSVPCTLGDLLLDVLLCHACEGGAAVTLGIKSCTL